MFQGMHGRFAHRGGDGRARHVPLPLFSTAGSILTPNRFPVHPNGPQIRRLRERCDSVWEAPPTETVRDSRSGRVGDRTDGYSTQPPGRSTEARRPAGPRPGGRGRSAQSQNNISRCFATLVNGALQDRESRVPRSHGHQHRHLYDRPNHRPGDIPPVHRGRPGIAREDRRTIRIAGRGLDRLFPLKHRPGRGPGTDQPLDRQAGRDRSPPVDVPAGRRRRPVLVAGRLDRLLSLDTIGQFAGLEGPALRG